MQPDDIHRMNISCTENLLNNTDLHTIPHPRPQYPDLNHLPLHVFVGYSRPMLRGFIYVHMFDKFKSCIDPGFKWTKNKGKLQDTINGKYNLITLAHTVAKNDILLSKNQSLLKRM